MAENVVEEISVLIADLKKENSVNANDLTTLLKDIKKQIEDVSDNHAVIDEIKSLLEKESGLDVNVLSSIKDELENLQSLLADTSDIFTLSDEVKLLSHNLKIGMDSIRETVGQDFETGNLLMSKLDSLERFLSNNGDIDALKEKILDLTTGYKQFTESFTNKNTDLQSVVMELKDAVNTSASNNFIASSSLESTIAATNNKISTISENITSGLGEMNSKVGMLSKDVRSSVNDGLSYLKHFGNSLTTYFQGNTTEVKTLLENLKAGILEFYKRMNKGLSVTQENIINKITDVHNLQSAEFAKTIENIELLSATMNVKTEEYKSIVSKRLDKFSETLENLKFVASAEGSGASLEFITDFNEKFKAIGSGYENLLNEALDEIKASKDSVASISEKMLAKLENFDGNDTTSLNKEISQILENSISPIAKTVEKLEENFDILKGNVSIANADVEGIRDIFEKLANEFVDKISDGENFVEIENSIRKLNSQNVENLEEIKSEIEKYSQNIYGYIEKIQENSIENGEKLDRNMGLILDKLSELDNINKNSLTLKEITEKLEGLLALVDQSDSGTMTLFKELRETLNDYKKDFDSISDIAGNISVSYTKAIEDLKTEYGKTSDALSQQAKTNNSQILAQFEFLRNLIENINLSEDFESNLNDIANILGDINNKSSENYENIRTLISECYAKIPGAEDFPKIDNTEVVQDLLSLRDALGVFYDDTQAQHGLVSEKLDELKSVVEKVSVADINSPIEEIREMVSSMSARVSAQNSSEDYQRLSEKIDELINSLNDNSDISVFDEKLAMLTTSVLETEQSIADKYQLLLRAVENCQDGISKNDDNCKGYNENYLAEMESLRMALGEFYDNTQFNHSNILEKLDFLSAQASDSTKSLEITDTLLELKELVKENSNLSLLENLSSKLFEISETIESNTSASEINANIENLRSAVLTSEQVYSDKINTLLSAIEQYIEITKADKKDLAESCNTEIAELRNALGEFYEVTQTNKQDLDAKLGNLEDVFDNFVNNYKNSLSEFNTQQQELLGNMAQDASQRYLGLSAELEKVKSLILENNDRDEISEKFVDITEIIKTATTKNEDNFARLNTSLNEYQGVLQKYADNEKEFGTSLLAELSDFKNGYSATITDLSESLNSQNAYIENEFNSLKEVLSVATNSGEVTDKITALSIMLEHMNENNKQAFGALQGLLTSRDESLTKFMESSRQVDILHLSELNAIKKECIESMEAVSEAVKNRNEDILSEVSVIKTLLESSSDKDEIIEQLRSGMSSEHEQTRESLNNLKQSVCEYNDRVETLSSELTQRADGTNATLDEILTYNKEILPTKENVQEIAQMLSAKSEEYRSTISQAVCEVEASVKDVLSEISHVAAKADTLEIVNNISELEAKLVDASSNYDGHVAGLREKVDDYFSTIRVSSEENNTKLERSINALTSIQGSIDTLENSLSNLIPNSGLVDILADVRSSVQKNMNFLTTQSEVFEQDVKTNLQSGFENIYDNVSLLGSNLEITRQQLDVSSTKIIEKCEADVQNILHQLAATQNAVNAMLSEKQEQVVSYFEPLKQAVCAFVESDFSNEIESIKSQLECAFVKMFDEFNSKLDESLSADKLEDAFKTSLERIDILKDLYESSSADILETVRSIFTTLNDFVQTNKDDEIISLINSLKDDISSRPDNTQTLDCIENELKNVSKSFEAVNSGFELLRTLHEKIDIFNQDNSTTLTEIEDVSNILDEVRENVAQIEANKKSLEKIEEMLSLVGEELKSILAKDYESLVSNTSMLKELHGKIDIFAQDDSVLTELDAVAETVDEIRDNLNVFEENKSILQIIEAKLDVIADGNEEEEELFAILTSLKNQIDTSLGVLNTDYVKIEDSLKELESVLQSVYAKSDDISGTIMSLDRSVDSVLSVSQNIKEELSDAVDTISSDVADCKEQHNYIGTNVEKVRTELENVSSNIEKFESSVIEKIEDSKAQALTISSKLSEIKTDTEIGYKLNDLMNALHNKVDVIAMADDSDVRDEIEEIHSLIEEHIGNFNTYASDKNVNNTLKDLLDKINKVDTTIGEIDLSKETSEIKTSVMNALVALTGEISFTEETEEIKDFVEERTDELHRTLISVKNQLSSITSNSDDINFYSYTLQDVEKDLAKIRFSINEIAGRSTVDDLTLISNNLGKMSKAMEDLRSAVVEAEYQRNKTSVEEDIVSISSRVNQILLVQKDLNEALLNKVDENSDIAQRIFVSNESIDEMLRSMNDNISYVANTGTVLKNVMTYLGEWMDDTSETLTGIYNRVSRWATVEDAVSELRKSLPDNDELVNFIETKFELQDSRIDRLEKKLEAINNIIETNVVNEKINQLDDKLSKLSENIEKLVSYVE